MVLRFKKQSLIVRKMKPEFVKRIILINLMILPVYQLFAGPPFDTDDPEPVKFRHWEYYVSSINNYQASVWTGTAPHFEINYGLVQNVQVHLLMPLNYNSSHGQGTVYGYADTEFGVKFRFVQETDNRPQIGTFPILEIPTVKNDEFSNGKTKIYLPVWLQKSWGGFTTYGGAGYWINPGTNNKNWIFAGWELQYSFSAVITLGCELYFHSADTEDSKNGTGFNIGGSINPSEKMHFIFSLGHTFTHDGTFTSYLGLQWTI
jgi:hypothetical protein